MKYIIIILTCLFIGCGVDTGSSVSAYEQEPPTSSFSKWDYRLASSSSVQHKAVFPTDLSYIGINKTSTGAKLVMRNNTSYTMVIKVNYTISCSVNEKATETKTSTITFYFDMYEQEENSLWVDYTGIKSLDCSGMITSIIPDDWGDKSNFQAWTGSYPISTK